MAPLDAWHRPGEPLLWSELAEAKGYRSIQIRCGQCIGCRLDRSKQWAIRCLHENQCHAESCFITLTYDDAHLPVDHSLRYSDFQLFMKRLRARYSLRQRIRFFMCGEYGELTARPHFHACIFGIHFDDRVLFKRLSSGFNIYTSDILNSLWPNGYSSVGDVSFESAAYVARYIVKKVTGDRALEHYKFTSPDGEVFSREPEFTHMSLKPGIGAEWFKRFGKEVFPSDEVVLRGLKLRPPKYYDNLLEATDLPSFEAVQFKRYEKSLALLDDATPARLRDMEVVTRARLAFKRRTLE